MHYGPFTRRLVRHAPLLVALLVTLAVTTTSCRKRIGTTAWTTATASVSPPPAPTPPAARVAAPATTGGLRFIAYNVENWLTMDRYVGQKLIKQSPKPAVAKAAVIHILTSNQPDVIGLCEIGEAKDLAEIQQALKAAALDLPYSQFTGGSDPVRHLGILSRYPLSPPAQPALTQYQMKGKSFAISRGILDTTIETHGKIYRLIGVHLKSKREIEDADQEEMRIHEARLLRRHVDSIIQSDAQARLIVYGDFNDTRSSPAGKIITGSYNEASYLTAIPAKDSRAEAWTHYWALHDIYSRFDFVTVSHALKPEVDFRASRLIDEPAWSDASDHRALLAIFR